MHNGHMLLFDVGASVTTRGISASLSPASAYHDIFPNKDPYLLKRSSEASHKDATSGKPGFLSAASLLCDYVQMMSLFLGSYSHL